MPKKPAAADAGAAAEADDDITARPVGFGRVPEHVGG